MDNKGSNGEWEGQNRKDSADHLVVLIHGLHGTRHDFDVLADILRCGDGPKGGVLVHIVTANERCTTDGVDPGARRVQREILELLSRHSGLRTLSLIGHSLGGIYARRTAYLLGEEGILCTRIRPAVFATIASPHLGAGAPPGRPLRFIVRVGARLLSRFSKTVRDLTMNDVSKGGREPPLLVQLADDAHVSSLEKFRAHLLWANTVGDLQCPCARSETGFVGVQAVASSRDREGHEGRAATLV
eukprot:gene26935-biopygen27892